MLTKTIEELKQVHIYGRTTFTEGGVNLFWSGSGLDFLFDGNELSMCYEADYETMEPWISVLVDGAWIMRMPAARGVHTIPIVREISSGTRHRIQILKDTQAMSGDLFHRLSIRALTYEGEIYAPPAFDLNIEWIGDSITSGEGCIGSRTEEDWACAFFSAVPAYGRKTSEKLNADFRILSQGGWGVSCAWDNNPYCNLPSCYDYICSLAGEKTRDGRALSGQERNDFSDWQADVVVVNLGTNDEGSFSGPAYHDPITGNVYQNRMLPDGGYVQEDLDRILRAQKQFLLQIRKNNPKAVIIWCYGMMRNGLSAFFSENVRAYRMENNDEKVFFLELPEITEETAGSREHPGAKSHAEVSDILTDFIKKGVNQLWK